MYRLHTAGLHIIWLHPLHLKRLWQIHICLQFLHLVPCWTIQASTISHWNHCALDGNDNHLCHSFLVPKGSKHVVYRGICYKSVWIKRTRATDSDLPVICSFKGCIERQYACNGSFKGRINIKGHVRGSYKRTSPWT